MLLTEFSYKICGAFVNTVMKSSVLFVFVEIPGKKKKKKKTLVGCWKYMLLVELVATIIDCKVDYCVFEIMHGVQRKDNWNGEMLLVVIVAIVELPLKLETMTISTMIVDFQENLCRILTFCGLLQLSTSGMLTESGPLRMGKGKFFTIVLIKCGLACSHLSCLNRKDL